MNTISSRSVARRSDIGKLAFNTDNSELYLCCSMYDYPSWLMLGSLSGANWMRHREAIAEHLSKDKIKGIEIERKDKDNIGKLAGMEKTRQMLKDLFDKMSPEEKKEFLKGNSNTWLSKTTCTVCMNTCEEKKKCVHLGCGGMCPSCHDAFQSNQDANKKCPCCGESQRKQCPICQEEKEECQLVKADGGCGHSVCWECFGKAYKAGRPVDSCPLCRGVFTQGANHWDSNDSADETDSDDDMPALEDDGLVDQHYDHAVFLALNNNGVPQPELNLSAIEIQSIFTALSNPVVPAASQVSAIIQQQQQQQREEIADETEMMDELAVLMENEGD